MRGRPRQVRASRRLLSEGCWVKRDSRTFTVSAIFHCDTNLKTPLLPLASSVLHDGKREGAASAVWTVTSA